MSTVAFIQARMSSSRFPGKVLEPLAGLPMIVYMARRARRARLLDEVVVVTSTDASDDAMVDALAAHAVPCFRGDLQDVLRRVLEGPLRELPARADITGCCGGSGRRQGRVSTTERMADDILAAAAEAGFERLVSFSSECVEALRKAYGRASEAGEKALPVVDHAVSLVAEAVIGDGAAAT